MSEHTYDRLTLALEQLNVALSLFLEGRSHASAITLAGAAEEVFGKELSRRGKQPVLDWEFGEKADMHRLLHGNELERKKFIEEKNFVRNVLKHFNDNEPAKIVMDLEDAAFWMLVRACENAHRLGLGIERFREFDDWFYEHVVGV